METMMTPTLEQTLASVIQQLANFFGTTTTAIMNNMPSFLTSFAWYSTFSDMWYIPAILLTGAFLSSMLWLVLDGYGDDSLSKFLKNGLIVSIIVCIFCIIKDIALCLICPEIVGGIAFLEKFGYLIK